MERNNEDRDRADIEQVFSKYVQSINAADVAMASEVWLQSPDLLVETPVGRFAGWDSVRRDIYVNSMQKGFTQRDLQARNISIVVSGDVAWVVYDFVYNAKPIDGPAFTATGWESHGYQRTADGWRIAHLHYSFPGSRL